MQFNFWKVSKYIQIQDKEWGVWIHDQEKTLKGHKIQRTYNPLIGKKEYVEYHYGTET